MASGFDLGTIFGGGPTAEEQLQQNGATTALPTVPGAAASVNTAGAQPYTAAQLALLTQLQQQAQGIGGPTQAQATLQSGLSQNLASNKALEAGARGNNQNFGLENNAALNANAGTKAATAGQAASLFAQEQANAEGQAGNLALSGAQQQQQVAEANANLANSQWQVGAQNQMSQNQMAGTLAGAQEAQNQSFGAGLVGDLFGQFKAPALAEGGVIDPEWEEHVTPIAGPGVNSFQVSTSGSGNVPGLAAIVSPAYTSFAGGDGGGGKLPKMGGGMPKSEEKAPDGSTWNDQSGGMAGGSGPAYYQSSTAGAPIAIPSEADMSGSAGVGADASAMNDMMADVDALAADGAVVDDSAGDNDDNASNPVQPNTTDFGGGSGSGAMSLVSLLAAADGTVVDPTERFLLSRNAGKPRLETDVQGSPANKAFMESRSEVPPTAKMSFENGHRVTYIPNGMDLTNIPAGQWNTPTVQPPVPQSAPVQLVQPQPQPQPQLAQPQPQLAAMAQGGSVLKGPKVILAGEAGPEAFVPLKDDGSMEPDPRKAKGPGMEQFMQALQAKGYKDSNAGMAGIAKSKKRG